MIKNKVIAENPFDPYLRHLIDIDVKRSFQYSKIIKPEFLANVLNVYAYVNTDVQYCQGMNFVAGFLMLITNNEHQAFRFMHCIFEKYQMKNLFIDDLPLLKEQLYFFDRLISIIHPSLGESFMINGINASQFSNNWFMTVFTQSIQHIKDDKPTPLLIKIWDYFLIDGWKAVFKVALFLVGELKDELNNVKLDKVMGLFGEISSSKRLHDSVTAEKFGANYKKIKITNSLLKILKNEYTSMHDEVQEAINNFNHSQ